jgi:hypothetical protein
MGRFETGNLGLGGNLQALMELPGRWIDRLSERKPVKAVILDLDSSVGPTEGHQEGSVFNGHFGCPRYRSLFCFNPYGDPESASRATARSVNCPAKTADMIRVMLPCPKPVVASARRFSAIDRQGPSGKCRLGVT